MDLQAVSSRIPVLLSPVPLVTTFRAVAGRWQTALRLRPKLLDVVDVEWILSFLWCSGFSSSVVFYSFSSRVLFFFWATSCPHSYFALVLVFVFVLYLYELSYRSKNFWHEVLENGTSFCFDLYPSLPNSPFRKFSQINKDSWHNIIIKLLF